MSFAGGKNKSLTKLVVMAFGIIIFMMLLCQCQPARAIRSFPQLSKENQELFSRFFNSSSSSMKFNTHSSTVIDSSKRKVPSCPDPLHNNYSCSSCMCCNRNF